MRLCISLIIPPMSTTVVSVDRPTQCALFQHYTESLSLVINHCLQIIPGYLANIISINCYIIMCTLGILLTLFKTSEVFPIWKDSSQVLDTSFDYSVKR